MDGPLQPRREQASVRKDEYDKKLQPVELAVRRWEERRPRKGNWKKWVAKEKTWT
jgi:hypothetical protein